MLRPDAECAGRPEGPGARSRGRGHAGFPSGCREPEMSPISWAQAPSGEGCAVPAPRHAGRGEDRPASGWIFSSRRIFITFSGDRMSGSADGAEREPPLRHAAVRLVLVLGASWRASGRPLPRTPRLPLLGPQTPGTGKLLHGAGGPSSLRRTRAPRRGSGAAAGRVRCCRPCTRGEVEERRARRVDRQRDVPRACHAECRDPGGLRVALRPVPRTGGRRVRRNEQHWRRRVLEEPCGQPRGQVLDNAAGGVDPSHERVWKRLASPRGTLLAQGGAACRSEDDVRVRAGAGQVVGEVVRAQLLRADVRRDFTQRGVVLMVERHLPGGVDPARGGQSQPALRKGFA